MRVCVHRGERMRVYMSVCVCTVLKNHEKTKKNDKTHNKKDQMIKENP